MRRVTRAISLLFLGVVVNASAAGAQHVSSGVAVGVGIPTGDLGSKRSPGPVTQVYAVIGKPDRIARLQISAEGLWCPGRQASSSLRSSAFGDLRVLSILGTILVAPPMTDIKPYISLGAGLQSVSIEGAPNPYGSALGVRSGGGIEFSLQKAALRAEISAHAILTDFGTGHEFKLATYVPVTLAIQF